MPPEYPRSAARFDRYRPFNIWTDSLPTETGKAAKRPILTLGAAVIFVAVYSGRSDGGRCRPGPVPQSCRNTRAAPPDLTATGRLPSGRVIYHPDRKGPRNGLFLAVSVPAAGVSVPEQAQTVPAVPVSVPAA